MAESATATSSKTKPKLSTPSGDTSFEAPKFETPKFEMPKVEVPAAFREMAEKGVVQAREQYEKMKAAAEEATDVLEDTYATAAKGCSGYGLKLIENTRTNTDAAFGLMSELLTAKSYAEMVELSSGYVRRQFDTLTAQAKDLADAAQKVAIETAQPMKDSVTGAARKLA
jgi:phasin